MNWEISLFKSGKASPIQGSAKPTRHGRIAQLVEQLTLNQRVLGSNPSASTISPPS